MEQILSEQTFQLGGCVSDECAVQVGHILGVQQMVAGSLSRIGEAYSVTLRLVDVETGELLSAEMITCRCSIEDVVEITLPDLVYLLTQDQNDKSNKSNKIVNRSNPEVNTHKGDLLVRSKPTNAKIYIDSHYAEMKTPSLISDMLEGRHKLVLKKDMFYYSSMINVKPDLTEEITLDLYRNSIALGIKGSYLLSSMRSYDSTNHAADVLIKGYSLGESVSYFYKKIQFTVAMRLNMFKVRSDYEFHEIMMYFESGYYLNRDVSLIASYGIKSVGDSSIEVLNVGCGYDIVRNLSIQTRMSISQRRPVYMVDLWFFYNPFYFRKHKI